MELVKKAIVGNDILQVIRIRPFFLLMLSQFFSQLAFNMQNFVLIFIIFGLTRSSTAVSALILSFTIPAVLLSVISGVHVDRWDKRKVLFFSNLSRTILILPLLIINIPVGLIYILTFLIAISTQFFLPAASAITPSIVPRSLIISANSILYMVIYGSMFLGYILAGPFLLFLSRSYTIIFIAFLYLLGSFFIFLIKKDHIYLSPRKKESRASFFKELHEIVPFIKKARKVVRAFIVLTVAQAIIFMFAVLGPGYVATVLNLQIENLSLIVILPAALGVGVGSFFLSGVGKKLDFKWLSAIGFMLSGLIFLLFPYIGNIASALPATFVLSVLIGFALSLIFIPGHATIQVETDENFRGRIYGLLIATSGIVSFLPIVLAGGFADLFGVGTVVAGAGILMISISALLSFFG
jgi:MFS family permease